MVGIFDNKGIMTLVNNTPLLATGVTREKVLGHKLWEAPWFAHKSESMTTVKRDMLLAAQGQSTFSDVQINTLDGELWIAFSTHPVFDDNEQVLQIVAEARDITARKTAEMELRASEQQLRRYRDQAPLAAIEMDTKMRVTGWNTEAEKMFGYTFAEVKGQAISFVMPNDNIQLESKRIWEELTNIRGGSTVISQFRRKECSLL